MESSTSRTSIRDLRESHEEFEEREDWNPEGEDDDFLRDTLEVADEDIEVVDEGWEA